jgi:hypothetical protein
MLSADAEASKRRRNRGIAIAAVAGLCGAFVLWLHLGTVMLVVRDERINLPHLDPADDGLRVAVLSDPHFGPGDASRAAEIADKLNALEPAVILLLGDFVNGDPDPRRSLSMAELTRFTRSLHAPGGVFAVTGNHELWYDRGQVIAALRAGGAQVLCNETVVIRTPSGRPLAIHGMTDYTTEPKPDDITKQQFPVDTPLLVMMHDPNSTRFLPQATGFGLAGHTHGGQFRLVPNGNDHTSLRLFVQRIKGKLGMIPAYQRPVILFDRGFTSYRDRRLFITSGAGGNRVKTRTFCPPELVLLRLYANDPKAARQRFAIPEEI